VREGSVLPRGRFARYGLVTALVVCGVALALVLFASFGASSLATGPRLLLLAVGILLLFVGIAMVAPRIARPIASVLGRPAEVVGGVSGQLARENSMRNPSRTAATAAALMIGLALVTAVAVLAAGLKDAFAGSVKKEFGSDYALTSQDGFTPTSISSAEAVRKSGVATVVAGIRAGDGRAFGSHVSVTGLDPGASKVLILEWKDGGQASMDTLGANGAVISSSFASSHNLGVGSPVRVETPAGKFVDLQVHSIYKEPKSGDPLGSVSMSSATFDSVYPNPQNVYTLINTSGGATPANTKKLNAVLRNFPDAKIQTESQFISNQEQGLNTFLALLYILLGLSIIVSLFGIVNTLILTVFERTREIGLLRAVGMTRRQVRRMIRHEAVITALLGAALGIPVGFGLAAVFDRSIKGIPFSVPWLTIAIFIVVAIIVGFLAAIFPARRASRLNVLNALHYE
jgi:putative ABC transport system permease protein